MNYGKKPILVWKFCDAPQEYKDESKHGGDEDWVVMVPNGVNTPEWIERLSPCSVSEHDVEGGKMFITAHA